MPLDMLLPSAVGDAAGQRWAMQAPRWIVGSEGLSPLHFLITPPLRRRLARLQMPSYLDCLMMKLRSHLCHLFRLVLWQLAHRLQQCMLGEYLVEESRFI